MFKILKSYYGSGFMHHGSSKTFTTKLKLLLSSFLLLLGIFLKAATFGGFLYVSSFSEFFNCHRFEVVIVKVLFWLYFPNLVKVSIFCQAIFYIKTRDGKQFLILLNSSSTYFFSLLSKAKSAFLIRNKPWKVASFVKEELEKMAADENLEDVKAVEWIRRAGQLEALNAIQQ
jgi:hypothetical protein